MINMAEKSGFMYKNKDPIYDMNTEEFENMAKDFGVELEHPEDLRGHSLDMWRAKWVFKLYKKDPKKFVVDVESLGLFKTNLS